MIALEKKEVVNNKEEKPFEHYCALYRETDPEEAAQRLGIEYDAAAGEFELVFLGNRYRVSFPEYSARCVEKKCPADLMKGVGAANILILRRLIEGKLIPAHGSFYTYKETPWGNVYNTQFTGRCISRLAFSYGKRIADFRRIFEAMGASPIENGDAGYAIELIPGYTLKFILWEADDEFPPSAQILFSDNFPDSFAPEDLVVCAELVINAMKETDRILKEGGGV